MLHTKSAWLRAAAPVAVLAMPLALTLTACGGKEDASGAQVDAAKSGSGAASGATAQKNAADRVVSSGLKPGQSGTRKFREGSGKLTVTYEIAAQKVHVGTEADAQKLVSDPKDAKGLVAATAFVKYTNKGGGEVTGLPDVDNQAEIYADGRRGGLLIGAAENLPGCDDPIDIDSWKTGQSHVICQTYMIPKGAKSMEVHWAADDADGDPLIWKFAQQG
ncbi:hypothetical protein [Streptomyces gilvosporeus]|uniref:Lipoprotein n=1 Tax=Streptomyces gilvosporeus TaxID=553510 RepID=A0A1V0TVQ6_9ACTN|nr:hypothetical protein [Streptomyces gilvosporeus]ARF56973.1 hypothetical protein B1H19_24875 [Streptomyces gilvosporeus]